MVNSKRNMNTYLIYSMLFILTASLSFFAFFLTQKTMIIDPDGYLQHYPLLVKLRHVIKEAWQTKSIPFWAWDTGLGADLIGNYAFELFDPFTYISVLLFKAESMDLGYTVGFIARMYASGVSFIYFYIHEDDDRWRSILGGLSYAFCSWVLTSMMHAFFLYPMILLPLIVTGINRVYRGQSPRLLIVSVFMLFIFSWYFTYMVGLILGIYSIVAYKNYRHEKFPVAFGKLVICVLVSFLLSACITLPTLYALLNASKEASTEAGLLHSLRSYLLLPASFFAGNEIFGNYSATAVNGVFIATMPLMFKRINLKKTPIIIWLICLVFTALPIFCRILNGLSYPSGRWMFIMTFFYIWSGLEILKENSRMTYIWVPFATAIYIVDFLWLRILPEYSEKIFIVNCLIALIVICLNNVINNSNYNKYKSYSNTFVMAIVVINIIITSNIRYIPSLGTGLDKAMIQGELYKRAANSAQRIAAQIDDGSFYRSYYYNNPIGYSMMHVPMNDNAFWGTRSIYEYLSTLDHGWHEFNKELCNSAGYSQRISVYGNDNRTRIDFLQGVKYYVDNSDAERDNKEYDNDSNSHAGYGFEGSSSIDETEILETRFNLGIGTVYDKVISRSEFDKLDYVQKEECLMQAAVVDDKELSKINIPTISYHELSFDSHNIKSEITASEGAELGKGKIKITEKKGGITIHADSVDNSEVYVVFHNLRKKVAVINTPLGEKQYGNFDITIKDGIKEKRICNYSGTNQAFNDVTEYCIDMGYYRQSPSLFSVIFIIPGEFEYDSIELIALPETSFAGQAEKLMQNKLKVESFNGTHITGKTNSDFDGILYLSILDNPGWKMKVNGQYVQKVKKTNIAFTGIPVQAGENSIEMTYLPPYARMGTSLTVIGIILCFMLCRTTHKFEGGKNTIV